MISGILHNQKINFFSLIAIQGANAILPLLVFPILLVKIGADEFSVLVIAEALSVILLAVVLYGFDISGINKLSKCNSEAEEQNVFLKILYSRIILFSASLPICLVAYLLYGASVACSFIFWMFVPLSHVFQSAYFFIYKQANLPSAIFITLSRLAVLMAVILMPAYNLNSTSAAFIIGFGYFLGSISSFIFIINFWKIEIRHIPLSQVYTELRETFSVFTSNVSVLLYRDLNVIILSMVFKNSDAISAYAMAEKIVKSIQALFRPISQFFTPKVMLSLKGNTKPNFNLFFVIWKYTKTQVILAFAACLVAALSFSVYLWSDFHANSVVVLALPLGIIMLLSIVVGILNYMFGMIGLNCLNSSSYLAACTLSTGLINIILCYYLSKSMGSQGAAISFVLAELVLFIMIFSKYKKLKVFRWI